jgi:hypothetical protein
LEQRRTVAQYQYRYSVSREWCYYCTRGKAK